MKSLALLLLALNLAFYYWQSQRPATPAAPPPETESGVERLQLLSEQSRPRTTPMPVCERVGPFERRNEAESVGQELRVAGASVTLDEESRSAFRVRSAPFATRAEAEAEVVRLASAGIGDAQVIPLENDRFGLALGVYATREAALRRRDTLATLGVRAELGPQDIVQRDYWIVLGVPPRNTAWWPALTARLPALRREAMTSCPR